MANLRKNYRRNSSQEAPQSHKIVWLMVWVGAILMFLPVVSASFNWTNGTVAYFKFDEGSGITSLEEVNQVYGDLKNSPVWILGKINYALRFDFTDSDYFNSTQIIGINGNMERSFNAWINWTGGEAHNSILSIGKNQDNSDSTFQISPTGVLKLRTHGSDLETHATINITTNKMFMLSLVWNGTTALFYINGTFVYNATRIPLTTPNVSLVVGIGWSAGEYFNGTIDEVGVWNKSLSPSEISELWNSGDGITYPVSSIVNLISPENASSTTSSSITFIANYSIDSTMNFTNSSIFVWKDNSLFSKVTNESISGTTNATNVTISAFSLGTYIWNVEACYKNTTFYNCSFAPSNYTFEVSAISFNNITYNPTTYESSVELLTLNITSRTGYTPSNAYLIYNGTSYSGTKTGEGNYALYSKNLTVPYVAVAGTNLPFYWSVDLVNATGTYSYNSSVYNQTVYKGTSLLANYTCPTGFSSALSFTFYWEQNLTTTNQTTINYYLTYGLAGNSSANSINDTLSNTNSFSICINNSQPYYNVGYGEIQYSVSGADDRRYYIFGGTRITNTTVNIPLYALETASATSFLMTAETTALVPYISHYIGLMRWYPSLNSYKIVDMGKTDDKGETVLRVKTEDVDYKFALYDSSGSLIKLSSSVRMICQTTPCIYTLYVDTSPLDLTTFMNIERSLAFNETTGVFTFIWNDPSQSSQTMNLTVYQDSGTSSAVICSSVSTGYTGILICDVSAYTGTLRAEVTRTASPLTVISQLIRIVRTTFIDAGGGVIGLFIGAILLILFALVGVVSPVLVIILSVVSLIPLVIFGNITIGIFTAIGVTAGVILHFLGRTR